MDRVNRILHNPKYRECVEKNRKYEEERIFCRHDMSHFLDVARLSWIENLEKGLGIEKELIYAAALLHDCGRFRQYEDAPQEMTRRGEAGCEEGRRADTKSVGEQ